MIFSILWIQSSIVVCFLVDRQMLQNTLNAFSVILNFFGVCCVHRCEWCGITAHPACHKSIPPECNFGVLEPIYLPPHCVSIPRTEISMETILGVAKKPREGAVIRKSFLAIFPALALYNIKKYSIVISTPKPHVICQKL